MDASRSTGPAPVPIARWRAARSPCQPCSSAKRQRHVRTAVRQRQRHCIGIDVAATQRLGAAWSRARSPLRMQRRRGEVEFVRGEPTGPPARCATSDSEPSPSQAGSAMQASAPAGRARDQPTRAGMAQRKRRAPFARFRSIVGRASNRASAIASCTPAASASGGPASLHIQFRRPVPQRRGRSPRAGQQVGQQGRVVGLDREPAVAQSRRRRPSMPEAAKCAPRAVPSSRRSRMLPASIAGIHRQPVDRAFRQASPAGR